mmetsp:Transcript_6710/g.22325  ORF Transcript_6710/g.22325 Transcript_6710/m.22325 type:complete len:325 (+) Transcript_6710:222-1196(+)
MHCGTHGRIWRRGEPRVPASAAQPFRRSDPKGHRSVLVLLWSRIDALGGCSGRARGASTRSSSKIGARAFGRGCGGGPRAPHAPALLARRRRSRARARQSWGGAAAGAAPPRIALKAGERTGGGGARGGVGAGPDCARGAPAWRGRGGSGGFNARDLDGDRPIHPDCSGGGPRRGSRVARSRGEARRGGGGGRWGEAVAGEQVCGVRPRRVPVLRRSGARSRVDAARAHKVRGGDARAAAAALLWGGACGGDGRGGSAGSVRRVLGARAGVGVDRGTAGGAHGRFRARPRTGTTFANRGAVHNRGSSIGAAPPPHSGGADCGGP